MTMRMLMIIMMIITETSILCNISCRTHKKEFQYTFAQSKEKCLDLFALIITSRVGFPQQLDTLVANFRTLKLL